MKYKYTFFTILIAILVTTTIFSSCEKKCCEVFQREDISFSLPNYWKINKIDSAEADFFFMSIIKVGYGASANAFIEWNKGKIALDTVMNITQQGYFEHKVFVDGAIKFSAPKMESYGTHKALTSEFNFKHSDVNTIGKIHCFYLKDCNKTVMIAYEQVAVDSAKQKADFKIIEESFGCRKVETIQK
jgi:hypothetical protein